MWTFLSDRLYDYYNSIYIGHSTIHQNTCMYYTLSYTQDPTTNSLVLPLPRTGKDHRKHRTVEIEPTLRKYEDLASLQTNEGEKPLRVIVISDTHEKHDLLGTLPACDLLIHTGDVLMRSRYYTPAYAHKKYLAFREWLVQQRATRKVLVGGNHDCHLEDMSDEALTSLFPPHLGIAYLCNKRIEVDGLSVFASPYSKGGSDNRAFQSKNFRSETIEALTSPSNPIDILITHGPCEDIREKVRPRLLHVFGHIHAQHGLSYHEEHTNTNPNTNPNSNTTTESDSHEIYRVYSVAAPIMNSKFDPHQLPVVIDCFMEEG